MALPPRPSFLLFLGVILCIGLHPVGVHAFSVQLSGNTEGGVIHWPQMPVVFTMHASCAPGLNTAGCLNAVRASFHAWEGAACSDLQFVEAGTSSNKQVTPLGYNTNGANEIAWISNGWPYGQSVLGVTSPVFYGSGEIIEADIAMNGANIAWSLTGGGWPVNVQSVAIHEIGHLFGLGHVLEGNQMAQVPTMAPAIAGDLSQQTPEPDDMSGSCFLAPAGAFFCGNNSACPAVVATGGGGEFYLGKSPCEGGACGGLQPMDAGGSGGSNTGSPCNNSDQCSSGLCVNDGLGLFCREPCLGDGDCPQDFFCAALIEVNFGACLPDALLGEGPDEDPPLEEGGDIGAGCVSNEDCSSGICAGHDDAFFCTELCQSDDACPDGWPCTHLGVGLSLCLPPGSEPAPVAAPGALADGESCLEDLACAGGHCAEGTCTRPCHVLDESVVCSEGMGCLRSNPVVGSGLCAPTGPIHVGELCAQDQDCLTLVCHQNTCVAPCHMNANSPCPFEMVCDPLGDFGYCTDEVAVPEAPAAPDIVTETPDASPDSASPEPTPYWPTDTGGHSWGNQAEPPAYNDAPITSTCGAAGPSDGLLLLLAGLALLLRSLLPPTPSQKESC